MSFTLAQLLSTQDVTQAIAELKQFLTGSGISNIDDWNPGTAQYSLLYLCAYVYSQNQQLGATLALNAFERTASGDFLTLCSDSFFDNQRFLAQTTQGNVFLQLNPLQGPYTIGPGGVTVNFTAPNQQQYSFTNQTQITLQSSSPTGSFPFAATTPGAGSSTIVWGVTGSVQGFPGITATLPFSSAPGILNGWIFNQGTDQETDTALHTRNETKWATLSTMEVVQDRLRNIVVSASLGQITDVGVNSQNPRGPGTLDIYCATPTSVATAQQLAMVSGSVQAEFFNGSAVVGGAPMANVLAAPTSSFGSGGVNTAITIWYAQNVKLIDLQPAVFAAADAWLAQFPPGGKTYDSVNTGVADVGELIDTIYNVDGVKRVTISNYQQNISLTTTYFQKLVAPPGGWSSIFVWNVLPKSFS